METSEVKKKRILTIVGYIVAGVISFFMVVWASTQISTFENGANFFVVLAAAIYLPWKLVNYFIHKEFKQTLVDWSYKDIYGKHIDIQSQISEINKSVWSDNANEIFPFDSREGKNYIKGLYNGISLELYDIKSIIHEGSGRYQEKVVIFQGSWIRMDYYREISKLLIKERGLNQKLKTVPDSMSKYVVDSVEFTDLFEVYSEEKQDAISTLSPGFIEKIMKLKELASDKKIVIGIVAGKISVVIEKIDCDLNPRLFSRMSDTDFKGFEENLELKLAIIDLVRTM